MMVVDLSNNLSLDALNCLQITRQVVKVVREVHGMLEFSSACIEKKTLIQKQLSHKTIPITG